MPNCPQCKSSLSFDFISFRQTCPHCNLPLHSCINCKFYQLGKPNDCLVPNTEPVKERAESNFCEEFKLKNLDNTSTFKSLSEIENKLFNSRSNSDPNKINPIDKLNSLFKDSEL